MLTVENLSKTYPTRRSLFKRGAKGVRAVEQVSFTLAEGETLALVGESGCGKSTLGRLVLNLLPASSGTVRFEGKEIQGLPHAGMRPLRRDLQIVFQDPYASLNPRMTVGEILAEPLRLHRLAGEHEMEARIASLLEQVGLDSSSRWRYPHAFSGGQRQRIGIARALSMHPKLIVCDEAVSALDVSIQAQILNLLKDLQQQLRLSYLFIAHDLSVVRHISHRVAVMYLGRIVEIGPTAALFSQPRHPYTRALLASVPAPVPRTGTTERFKLMGEPPSPINSPTGCAFHPRCAYARERCRQEVPALLDTAEGRQVACHFYRELPFFQSQTLPDTPARQRIARLAAAFSPGAAKTGSPGAPGA